MGYINGCAILLQVWLFEHTTLWEPSVPDARPRLLKWTARIDTRMKEHTTLITLIRDRKLKKKEVLKCLLPIPEEESLLSIVADDVDNLDDPLLPREEGQRQFVVEDDVLDVDNVLIAKHSTPISMSNVAVKRRRWTKKETDKEKNKVDGEEKPISRAELNFIVGRLRQLEDEVAELEDEVAELKRKLAEGEQEAEGQDGDEGGGEVMKGGDDQQLVIIPSQDTPEVVEGEGPDGGDDQQLVMFGSQDRREGIEPVVISIHDTPVKPMGPKVWSIERVVKLGLRRKKASQYTSSPYRGIGRKKTNNKQTVTEPQNHRLLGPLLALPKSHRVIQINNEYMCAEDLVILNDPVAWLTSPLMNVYGEYLNVRDERNRKPRERACVSISTYLYDCITDKGYAGPDSVEKYVCRLNQCPPDTLKRVLFPVHVPQHWILLVLDMVDEKFYIYNSLKDVKYWTEVRPLVRYLEGLYLEKWKVDVSKFLVEELDKRPIQRNSNDCGLFVLKEMDCLARDVPPKFSQAEITVMRRQLLVDTPF
ncbi:uncharacterized protein LOC143850260 [Tasmannia lanceolata]|uniref:uncharacterized protein LOC143850260 n=1 Tax=Tasmannia lanceolata TaxID=3420 RepID=UPI0040637CD9